MKKMAVATLEFVCVYNKKHRRTIQLDTNGQTAMPFCVVDGGPMIAAKASIQSVNHRKRR